MNIDGDYDSWKCEFAQILNFVGEIEKKSKLTYHPKTIPLKPLEESIP